MISIIWCTLGSDDSLIKTSLSSPFTLTYVLSSCMILVLVICGTTFIFWHTEKGIMLDDAPESARQLCTLKLKIS
jgi:hypothetical protein